MRRAHRIRCRKHTTTPPRVRMGHEAFAAHVDELWAAAGFHEVITVPADAKAIPIAEAKALIRSLSNKVVDL